MNVIYGLYASPVRAERAFRELRLKGIGELQITVISSEPLEEFDFGNQHRQTHMPWLAVLGGALGLSIAYFLTALTQQAWPINTGGMPIVTTWTNLVIMFELTMLGAALTTVLALLVSARIPGRIADFYDPLISEGMTFVGVTNPHQDNVSRIENALRSAGAEKVVSRPGNANPDF